MEHCKSPAWAQGGCRQVEYRKVKDKEQWCCMAGMSKTLWEHRRLYSAWICFCSENKRQVLFQATGTTVTQKEGTERAGGQGVVCAAGSGSQRMGQQGLLSAPRQPLAHSAVDSGGSVWCPLGSWQCFGGWHTAAEGHGPCWVCSLPEKRPFAEAVELSPPQEVA